MVVLQPQKKELAQKNTKTFSSIIMSDWNQNILDGPNNKSQQLLNFYGEKEEEIRLQREENPSQENL